MVIAGLKIYPLRKPIPALLIAFRFVVLRFIRR